MKKYDIKVIKRFYVWLSILIFCNACDASFFGITHKNYYHSEDDKNCVTIILYTAELDIFNIVTSCSSKYDPLEDDGKGIYIIPGKFEGYLPKDNYIRLKYIWDLTEKPIYFRWENDSLVFREDGWSNLILENKLSPAVKIDSIGYLDYERGWFRDSIADKKMLDEWNDMRKKYHIVLQKDLKAS